jgi:predicted transcriptional regulator
MFTIKNIRFGGGFMVKKDDIFDVFFRKKPAMILVALRKSSRSKYGSVLAKEVDCTYSHAVKILQQMEKSRLVSFEKQGRIKLIKLTDSGDKIAQSIESIRELL